MGIHTGKIERKIEMNIQKDYLVDVIMTWIEKELARAKEN